MRVALVDSRRRRRVRRRLAAAAAAVAALALAYLALLWQPALLFRHAYAFGPVSIHATRPLDATLIAPRVDSALVLLRTSALYRPSFRQHVFVAGSPFLYAVLNGPGRPGLARNSEIGNHIFLPILDAGRGVVRHFDGRSHPLVPILAHEMTHSLVQREVGMRAALRLPFWKKEGYAEFVARPDASDLRTRVAAIPDDRRAGMVETSDGPVPAHYYIAGLCWEYLIEVRGLDAAAVLRDSTDAVALERAMLRWAEAARG